MDGWMASAVAAGSIYTTAPKSMIVCTQLIDYTRTPHFISVTWLLANASWYTMLILHHRCFGNQKRCLLVIAGAKRS
ncbi:hypothetical protein LINGRAPRIM_LOCUS2640 [Linum grandiflorum]